MDALSKDVDKLNDESTIQFASVEIDFELENQDAIALWLTDIAQAESRSLSLLEYVLCSDEYLLAINKEYLNHDYYTDIITFPLQESPLEATIYISIERVKENAQLYNCKFEDELHRVIAHGLLHLIGHTDKTDEDKKNMRIQENACLDKRTFL